MDQSLLARAIFTNGDNNLLEYNTSGSTPLEKASHIGTGDIDDNLMVIKNGKTYFYHKDHLGSVIAVTDGAGEVVQKNQYSSFGKILSIKKKEKKLESKELLKRVLLTRVENGMRKLISTTTEQDIMIRLREDLFRKIRLDWLRVI